jgi:hypothetical protein
MLLIQVPYLVVWNYEIQMDLRSVVLEKKCVLLKGTNWLVVPASTIEGAPLTIGLTVPSPCVGKVINGLRYLWRETPCSFKQAAIYSTLDSNLSTPPYIKFF